MMTLIISIAMGVMLYVICSAFNQMRIYYAHANASIYKTLGYEKTLFGWRKPKQKT